LEREQWSEASDALLAAIEKGEIDSPGSVNLLLGIAFYQQQKITRAHKYFRAALSHETSSKPAAQWLELLAREAAERESEADEGESEADEGESEADEGESEADEAESEAAAGESVAAEGENF
jgi:Tfp pilus assembly protein PilF